MQFKDKNIEQIKITVLVEDTKNENLPSAHGLSLYIETPENKILFDMGPNELFWENAEFLGIDLNTVDTAVISHGHYDHGGGLAALIAKAKAQGVPIKEADPKKLEHMCGGANHQGVVAVAAVKEYASLEEIFARAEERGEPLFLVICDGLEDPHNLGAVIRTAECAGAHGVVIPKRRSVGLTYAVGKASAGAVEHLPVARVQNVAALLEDLKARGVWIYTADMDGSPWCQTDFTGPAALVIGSEGSGVSRLVKERSDFVVSLPIKGQVNSLNASVAAGVLCYEVARQRSGLQAFEPKRREM